MEFKELDNQKHDDWMLLALEEAKKAEKLAEVPIGAIVVLNNEIIGKGYNLRETTQDATTHAEMIAIREACQKVGSWRLEEARLYVTLEPCPMCSGAMILSRIKEVYFGAYDPKGGVAGTLMNLLEDERFNHQVHVVGGVLEKNCRQILSDFFKELRVRKKKKS
ncbi:tRNA adenosine(34) deaminase TadA [Enterococcus ratti]|uniref:tRNA-specific adenosine deaminase n=1 Tax=Enterococcus ratti TaxID=150033 RepID=A0A1L8WGY6_9ENTE|nr:tRNA adenosine(34) deaminase TadA [Enterococcus ratti]OJG80291.1 cytidine/deoxycytidylate deaminase [Enterococcus ratti]